MKSYLFGMKYIHSLLKSLTTFLSKYGQENVCVFTPRHFRDDFCVICFCWDLMWNMSATVGLYIKMSNPGCCIREHDGMGFIMENCVLCLNKLAFGTHCFSCLMPGPTSQSGASYMPAFQPGITYYSKPLLPVCTSLWFKSLLLVIPFQHMLVIWLGMLLYYNSPGMTLKYNDITLSGNTHSLCSH